MNTKYDSTIETQNHIGEVRGRLARVIASLANRALVHDASKLVEPEKAVFDEFTPKLRDITYGSTEYHDTLRKMHPAIEHHNRHNRHHPEFHCPLECILCFAAIPDNATKCPKCGNGEFGRPGPTLARMNLIDLLEMLCDWKAATLRHADGDVRRSIEYNQGRFAYGDELKQILLNTLDEIE